MFKFFISMAMVFSCSGWAGVGDRFPNPPSSDFHSPVTKVPTCSQELAYLGPLSGTYRTEAGVVELTFTELGQLSIKDGGSETNLRLDGAWYSAATAGVELRGFTIGNVVVLQRRFWKAPNNAAVEERALLFNLPDVEVANTSWDQAGGAQYGEINVWKQVSPK